MSVPTEPIPGQSPLEETTPEKRPRHEIDADFQILEQEKEQFEEDIEPLREWIAALSEDQREIINEFAFNLDQDDPEREVVEVPGNLAPLAEEIEKSQKQAENLMEKQLRLEKEMTPYRKEDLIKLVNDLSARIDYDAAFNYYREKEYPGATADLIENTVSDLFRLRKYQFEVSEDEGVRDFDFYDRRCFDLEESQKAWQEKGFLKDSSDVDEQGVGVIENPVTEERQELVRKMGEVLADLDTYRRLAGIYQFKISYSYPFDAKLEEVYRVLNVEKYKPRSGYRKFEEIGFDPRFIEAAIRNADRVVTEHQKLGHLPSEERTGEEVRSLEKIRIEGFQPSEGMVSALTPQEIQAEIKNYLPPYFLDKLKAITHRKKPENFQNEEGIETIGCCRPSYDKDKKLTGLGIEIYRSPFLPEGASEAQLAFLMSDLKDSLWHELGHAAQHLMRFEELVAWEEAINDDDMAVSRYVKRSRSESEIKGKQEDFADTFSLFVSDPAKLIAISPSRFGFMVDFFKQRLTDDQREAFSMRMAERLTVTHSLWKELGLSTKDIRVCHLYYLG